VREREGEKDRERQSRGGEIEEERETVRREGDTEEKV
jgi:hypothetical protein